MSKITNKEYEIKDCVDCIIKTIPRDRLIEFYKKLPEIVEWQREHKFDLSVTWIDDGKNDEYINGVKNAN